MIPLRILKSALKPVTFPILCNYYVTTRCNAKCSFCNIHLKKGINANLHDVLANLESLKKLGIKFIDFTGGEPLVYPHLYEILRRAKELNFITTVTTNTILYPKMAEKLSGLIDLLHFSLDSLDPDEHNRIRGVECFNSVMQSIDIAKSIGERPDIIFTVSKDNIYQLRPMIKFAKKKRLILLINPVFSYYGNPHAGNDVLYKILSVASEPFVYVNRGIIHFMLKGGNSTSNPRCRGVTTTIAISPENSIYLPCYHKYTEKIAIEHDLIKTYNSSRMAFFKDMQGKFPFCEKCTISCYFDPSFAYGIDYYFFLSQVSKIKYTFDKYFRKSNIDY